jgi:protein SCO1/2
MKRYRWIILAFLAIWVGGMFIVYPKLRDRDRLPIYNPADINPKLVDTDMQRVGMNHRIADFSLTDQMGATVTNADVAGKVYVADFFFVTCPSICPKMSKNMSELAMQFKGEPRVMFLSHSVFPDKDSVPVLAAYGAKYNADPAQWKLLTGSKPHIYELARRSYFAVTTEGDGGPEDFIHTENFVLVDPDRRLRGFYDGTDPVQTRQLGEDIKKLLREYEKQ